MPSQVRQRVRPTYMVASVFLHWRVCDNGGPARSVLGETMGWWLRRENEQETLSQGFDDAQWSEAWVHIAMVNLMLKRLQPT